MRVRTFFLVCISAAGSIAILAAAFLVANKWQSYSAEIEAGRLVPVLEDWQTPAASVFLYYSGRRQVPAPLQAFIEFLRVNLRAH